MRKFGIEIETASPITAAELNRLLNDAGIPCVDHSHTHNGNSNTHWMLKYDGSLNRLPQGTRGIEVVSPPLDFDDPEQRASVSKVADVMRDAGCRPCDQTGIHVHIEGVNRDGSNLTPRQIAAVACFFYKFEDAIYRIASSGWESIRGGARTYAKPIPEATAKALGKVRTGADLRNVWNGCTSTGRRINGAYSLDRYFAVNLHSYWLRNTIEFRCFNGSVNGDRMQAYIALCMAIVEDARHGHFRYAGKNYPLGAMRGGCVKPEAVMLRLQQVLRSAGRDTDVLMDVDDWKRLRKVCWRDSVPQAPMAPTFY